MYVDVLDENDSAPAFQSASYAVTLSEGVIPGYVALRVTAHDADLNSAVTYSIVSGNADNAFVIDPRSGKCTEVIRSQQRSFCRVYLERRAVQLKLEQSPVAVWVSWGPVQCMPNQGENFWWLAFVWAPGLLFSLQLVTVFSKSKLSPRLRFRYVTKNWPWAPPLKPKIGP